MLTFVAYALTCSCKSSASYKSFGINGNCERPATVVIHAARLVIAARLVREEVVGSFDIADHVLDGKAHLEQAARVALRRPAPRATAGGAAAAALRRSRLSLLL